LCPEPNLGTLLGLAPSHKRQGRHADSHRRREDRPQSRKAGHQSRTGGEDIVDEEDVAENSCLSFCPVRHECATDIGSLGFGGQSGLGGSASATAENVGVHGGAEGACNFFCDDLGLVISSFPASAPMQGNRNDGIDICKMSGAFQP